MIKQRLFDFLGRIIEAIFVLAAGVAMFVAAPEGRHAW